MFPSKGLSSPLGRVHALDFISPKGEKGRAATRKTTSEQRFFPMLLSRVRDGQERGWH